MLFFTNQHEAGPLDQARRCVPVVETWYLKGASTADVLGPMLALLCTA